MVTSLRTSFSSIIILQWRVIQNGSNNSKPHTLSQRRERTIAKIDTDRDRMYLFWTENYTSKDRMFFLMFFKELCYAHQDSIFFLANFKIKILR